MKSDERDDLNSTSNEDHQDRRSKRGGHGGIRTRNPGWEAAYKAAADANFATCPDSKKVETEGVEPSGCGSRAPCRRPAVPIFEGPRPSGVGPCVFPTITYSTALERFLQPPAVFNICRKEKPRLRGARLPTRVSCGSRMRAGCQALPPGTSQRQTGLVPHGHPATTNQPPRQHPSASPTPNRAFRHIRW